MRTRSIGSGPLSAMTLVMGLSIGACGSADASRPPTRDTLANGAVAVTYSAFPEVPVDSLVPEVRIGKVDGEAWETFGSIRGLEAGPDGTIYVLDFQASEVRAFDANGAYVATLARSGEGPGEIRQANGMVLGSDGTLWVQDHGADAILGLSPEGREIARHPMMVNGYGFEWGAAIDGNGVIRQSWFHSDVSPSAIQGTFGLLEIPTHIYLKSFDLSSQTSDSIFLGERLGRMLVVDRGGGRSSSSAVPFDSQPLSVIDRMGSIWLATSDAYRITRIDSAGDTALILDVPLQGPAVTGEERSSAETRFEAAGVTPMIPERKPVLSRLLADDEGRLWVERALEPEQPRRLDAFSREGDFLGSMTLPLTANSGTSRSGMVTPVIRAGHIYLVVLDELDVSYVIRAPLPAFAR